VDMQLSLEAEPNGFRSAPSLAQLVQRAPSIPPIAGTPTETVPRHMVDPLITAPTEDTGEPIPDDPDPSKPRGFWGSLFKKRK